MFAKKHKSQFIKAMRANEWNMSIFWAWSHLGNNSTVPVTFISEANGLWNTRSEATSHDFPFCGVFLFENPNRSWALGHIQNKRGGKPKKNKNKKNPLEISTYILWTCEKKKTLKYYQNIYRSHSP